MLAESVNESYRLRSSYLAVNGGEDAWFDTAPLEFVDPIDREARDLFKAARAEAEAQSQATFEAELGFS